ncbi:Putative acetyltransferase OS=Streptomyces violarus OX=67380 GN=FHS41_007753 PE=3 SV=1 [Streptomyces violarus]
MRILDVVRALEARTYEGPGGGGAGGRRPGSGLAGGRWRLEASAEGASCAATAEGADLVLGAGELAALWLGDASAVRLAALGVREESSGRRP